MELAVNGRFVEHTWTDFWKIDRVILEWCKFSFERLPQTSQRTGAFYEALGCPCAHLQASGTSVELPHALVGSRCALMACRESTAPRDCSAADPNPGIESHNRVHFKLIKTREQLHTGSRNPHHSSLDVERCMRLREFLTCSTESKVIFKAVSSCANARLESR